MSRDILWINERGALTVVTVDDDGNMPVAPQAAPLESIPAPEPVQPAPKKRGRPKKLA